MLAVHVALALFVLLHVAAALVLCSRSPQLVHLRRMSHAFHVALPIFAAMRRFLMSLW